MRRLSHLSAYPTCDELEQVADTLGQSQLDAFRREELEYDRTTRHGEFQDARFP